MLHEAISEVTKIILAVARENRLRKAFSGPRGTDQIRKTPFKIESSASSSGDQEERAPGSNGETFTLGDIYRYYVRKNRVGGTESTNTQDATSESRN